MPRGSPDGTSRNSTVPSGCASAGVGWPALAMAQLRDDGVVDRVEAGGAGDGGLFAGGGRVLVDEGDQLIEVAEDFVGRQVEGGEVVHGGAQPAHGGRGMQSVPDDVAHDQRDSGAGQRDDVEPVAADSLLRREVTRGDLDGVLFGQRAGQQAALERHGHAVLAGVAPCVVEGHRGAGGQFGREGEVVLLEGLGLLRAVEVDDAQQHAAGGQRRRDERMDPVTRGCGMPERDPPPASPGSHPDGAR